MAISNNVANTAAIQLRISQWLIVGIFISVIIALAGGLYFLSLHGTESVYSQAFYAQKPAPGTLVELISAAFQLMPTGIMQLGIFILVVTQLFRVILVGWYFFKVQDAVFVAISLVILMVLVYSLFYYFGFK